jgi:coenzyme F420-reducing hydrogenase beta subunit
LPFSRFSSLTAAQVECLDSQMPHIKVAVFVMRYHVDCAQMVAWSKADILAARGVKPTLSPNLNVLATVEALDVKRLLFIGVGCQV